MRKLLVASQKGGVGKTTTSINLAAGAAMAGTRVLLLDADPLSSISNTLKLAEHPQRQTLRQAGIDLPGVLVSDFLPGLDVLSPYEDGGCSDADLDRLLALIGTKAFESCYGCLVVDTPPFMGANPGQLLATSDQFVIVMRAEAMAYRTLPAFLELIQRQKSPAGNPPIKMRGILLTLPDGEEAGGRWERELRGRFGSRILPEVVPYDEVANQAQLFGQVVSQSQPSTPVAAAYRALVQSLELTSGAHPKPGRTTAVAALQLAMESVKSSPPATIPVAEVPVAAKVAEPVRQADLPRLRINTMPEMEEIPEPIRRRLTPILPLPAVKPSAKLDNGKPRPPAPRRSAEAPPPARPEPAPAPARNPTRPAAQPAPAAPAGAAPFPLSMGLLWVGVAMALGIGLRFLQLPDYLIPVVVGLGVAAVVVLAMLFLMPKEQEAPAPQPASAPGPRAEAQPAGRANNFTRRAISSTGRGRNDQ